MPRTTVRRVTPPGWLLRRWLNTTAEMAGLVGGVTYRPGSVEALLERLQKAAGWDTSITWAELRRAMAATLRVLLDELEAE